MWTNYCRREIREFEGSEILRADTTGLAKMMRRLAGRQMRYHNQLECRTGSLWEGRYKSSVRDELESCDILNL